VTFPIRLLDTSLEGATEDEYRASRRESERRLVVGVGVIALIVTVVFVRDDLALLPAGSALTAILAGRAMVVALAFTVLMRIGRTSSYASRDLSVFALVLSIVLLDVGVGLSRPVDFMGNAATRPVFVFAIYTAGADGASLRGSRRTARDGGASSPSSGYSEMWTHRPRSRLFWPSSLPTRSESLSR